MISESSIEPNSAHTDPEASVPFSESESNIKQQQTLSDIPIPVPNPIKVAVGNPQVKQENLIRYTLYSISGSDVKGIFEAERRYNDFAKIRQILAVRWPGCYIPPLPPKKINNMDSSFVGERMRYLELFCQRITESPYLHYSPEYQIFIRSSRRYLDTELAKFETAAHGEIIQRYHIAFEDLKHKEVNNQTIAKIAEFRTALQKVVEYFGVLHDAAHRFARKRKAFYEKMSAFHETVCIGYEKTIFKEYHNNSETGNVFTDSGNYKPSENSVKMKQAAKRESVDHFCDWLETESIEVTAFLNAFTERDKYEHLKNKAQEKQQYATIDLQNELRGKHNWVAMLFGKSKQETKSDLEKEIYNATNEINNFRMIHEMITLILAYKEIDKFKINKLEKYYQIIRLAAENELANLNSAFEYWNKISNNENIRD